MEDFTVDNFLGGRITLKQPRHGFRAGSDSVFLAASIFLKSGASLLDLGCGCGTVLSSVAYRFPGAMLYGLETNLEMCGYAQENSQQHGHPYTVLQGDVFSVTQEQRLKEFQQKMDVVSMNPPYYQEGMHTAAPEKKRALARTHAADNAGILGWLKAASFFLKDKGFLYVVYPSDGVDAFIEAARKVHFGSISLYPLWPKKNVPAKRVLMILRKNTKGVFKVLPGLILHQETGESTPEAERVLRDGAGLDVAGVFKD